MKELKKDPTVKEIQDHLQEFVVLRGWDSKTFPEVFMLFTEEVGELAKSVRKYIKLHDEEQDIDNLTEELADVFNYLMEIANRTGIDLEQAYRIKYKLNSGRLWPGDIKNSIEN